MNDERRQRRQLLHAAGLAAVMASAPVAAWRIRPDEPLTLSYPKMDLEQQIPEVFAGWRVDRSLTPLVPDPVLQQSVQATYDQNIARTYINDRGERVMVTVAYGADQGAEATQVHRPEICYGAQGFVVRHQADELLALPEHRIAVRRLFASLGRRMEPVSYWVTLGDTASLPGWRRKLEQIRIGLAGKYADGLLMRFSSFGTDTAAAYTLHDRFVRDLYASVAADVRPRYFGS
ncbi:EpsI family protein [Sphaerotilus hippei]|uniref:EpsI family protein n=1 Tax=Sphaerotilus hippei TaxID=744406 RepID=A0A318H0U7_9BURK|nr:exosortase-associated protein EpsI, B-type [Sphaerotilus hippei]PXW94955.1 EpsI family protein [Sphaerotilus hippei]